ncbi:ROK family transcriptional regulator [Actinoplanes couchii]|uniref:Transcriptional regulator n=2 Tax=Actinoplanes couchii TaxID=403638 RepID=A0ABQ3X8I2_9ACTN|nr:ROK family transcriptional regulator [Actinoplanes couchii]GID54806.1 transcriptional regulator [Actinoplanes couchii]
MVDKATARTATARVVTDINRTAVLDALAHAGPLSRNALREHTGLSPVTIKRLCTALLDEGLIVQVGTEKSQGGRPSHLYRFASERRVIITAEVTVDGPRAMLVGVDGSAGDRESRPVQPDTGADVMLATTLELIGTLLTRAQTLNRTVLGIALSVPGVVDREGRVSNSVELGWQQLAVGPVVEHRFGLPCLVENDANAIAIGEWAHGAGAGTDSLVSVVLGVGIGAGLVSDGRLVRGTRSGAGKIGHLLTGLDSFDKLFVQQGDLESHIGDTAARYRGDRRVLGVARVLDAADAGHASARGLADKLLNYLALSVAALSTVLDPEVIVFSGQLPQDPAGLVRALEQRLTGRIPFIPRLVAGRLGADAAMLGVGELLARRTKGAVYLS